MLLFPPFSITCSSRFRTYLSTPESARIKLLTDMLDRRLSTSFITVRNSSIEFERMLKISWEQFRRPSRCAELAASGLPSSSSSSTFDLRPPSNNNTTTTSSFNLLAPTNHGVLRSSWQRQGTHVNHIRIERLSLLRRIEIIGHRRSPSRRIRRTLRCQIHRAHRPTRPDKELPSPGY